MKKMCSVGGCSKDAVCRGWCFTHYKRWSVSGDPSFVKVFQRPKGSAKAFFDSVLGEGEGCLIWPYNRNADGYAVYSAKPPATRVVSRAICEKFHGRPPSRRHDSAHSCGNGHLGCIAPWHLSWKTRKENSADADLHGTRLRGEKANGAKLTDRDVVVIRGILKNPHISHRAVSLMYGISRGTVGMVNLGKTWGHIE